MRLSPKPRLLSAALILLSLPACSNGSIVATVNVSRVCEAWPQVNIRKADKITAPTAADIEKANVGREGIGCLYEKPFKAAKAATS